MGHWEGCCDRHVCRSVRLVGLSGGPLIQFRVFDSTSGKKERVEEYLATFDLGESSINPSLLFVSHFPNTNTNFLPAPLTPLEIAAIDAAGALGLPPAYSPSSPSLVLKAPQANYADSPFSLSLFAPEKGNLSPSALEKGEAAVHQADSNEVAGRRNSVAGALVRGVQACVIACVLFYGLKGLEL